MIKTSASHPLQIDYVTRLVGAGSDTPTAMGRIGMTFCPGKQQESAFSGTWQRDLSSDISAISDTGAAAVVTLVEAHELDSLKVSALGEEVGRHHMDWLHLPIRDVSVPDPAFEALWQVHGEGLRSRLRNGFDIVVHCKGGLGRAGTIAARLLVELGTDPGDAIAQVRTARPGTIETRAQESHVRNCRMQPEREPKQSVEAIHDRALGALLGLAVGDALGTTLEFKARDTYEPLTTIVGGGPFRLKAGQWTDDTAMALALADSLIADPHLDQADLMHRFVQWQSTGAYSCTGTCFDIGITCSSALARWQRTGDPVAGSTDAMSAGNGALMRLAPVALRWWRDKTRLIEVATRQTVTTHGAPEAVSASCAFAGLLADAIGGMPPGRLLGPKPDASYRGTIAAIMAGSWRGKRRDEIKSSGYVAHSLEAALWATARTTTFKDAVLLAANLGGDADTTAAITGQLAGAIYGASAIPQEWLEMLTWLKKITTLAETLSRNSFEEPPNVLVDRLPLASR